MAPVVAAGLALFELVPSLLRVFGKERPAQVAEQVGELAKVVTGASDPEQATNMIKADPQLLHTLTLEIDKRAMDWARMYMEDIKDARARDVELAKAGVKNTRANWLAFSAVFTVFVIIAIVIWYSDLNEYVKGIVTLILGRALGWVEQIFSFEFGTTRTSKTKDETISKLSNT